MFVAVVQASSLSAAASRLGTPLSTLSRQIRDLEWQLKVQLLARSPRGTKLTDAGVMVTAARPLIWKRSTSAESWRNGIRQSACTRPIDEAAGNPDGLLHPRGGKLAGAREPV